MVANSPSERNIEVSVIVPAFRSPDRLKGCLEALAKQQTARNFEVVVVDDGSPETLEPVTAGFERSLSIRFLRLENNGGPASARNAGIRAAHGGVILFTDSDCRPQKGWLEAMASPFDDPEVGGVKGRYRTEQKDTWARLAQLEFEERYELLESAGDIDFIDTYSGGFRREDLLSVGGFDTSFPRADNEDVDLSFRVKGLGRRFRFVPGAVVLHRHREGFLGYAALKFSRGFWRMKVYRKHPGKAGKDSYTPLSLKLQLLLSACFLPALSTRRRGALWAGAWLATCAPLLRWAARNDPSLVPLIPFFALTRGLAIILGMIFGTANEMLTNPRNLYQTDSPETIDQTPSENRRS